MEQKPTVWLYDPTPGDRRDELLTYLGATGTPGKIISEDTNGFLKEIEEYASFEYEVRDADWMTHGRDAEKVLHRQMIEDASAMLVFRDGSAKTQTIIEKGIRAGLDVLVVTP